MNVERVPKHGKADVAFAGAQLGDAWLLIGSVFVAMVIGSIFGWLAYIGIPVLGYFLTKAYIQWKNNNLPGHLNVLLYRVGLTGYSAAFDRKKKLFIGDSTIVNPAALRIAAVVRGDARAARADAGPRVPHRSDDTNEIVT
jgi:hypothetical protein